MWVGIGAVLGCGFVLKGDASSDFLWAAVVGAANGAAIGFAVGPAATKGARFVSALLVSTPFYFMGISILIMEWSDARKIDRAVMSLSSIFVALGLAVSLAQEIRVRRRCKQRLSQ
jgi:uncharacterized protein YfiM (DUF2279 family)